jgi:heme-degrading monooxygenase HmoA
MFAYILRAPGVPPTPQTEDFFRRFTETPGLIQAFDLQGVDDPGDAVVLAIWEDRAAAERYLNSAPLRKEVDGALPSVTRTMYEVMGSKMGQKTA